MVTGKKTAVGNKVSHSNRKVRRTFGINLHYKRIWDIEAGCWKRVRVTRKGLKTIDKHGLGDL